MSEAPDDDTVDADGGTETRRYAQVVVGSNPVSPTENEDGPEFSGAAFVVSAEVFGYLRAPHRKP